MCVCFGGGTVDTVAEVERAVLGSSVGPEGLRDGVNVVVDGLQTTAPRWRQRAADGVATAAAVRCPGPFDPL